MTGIGRALPGLGYALSLTVCAAAEKWLIARWGPTGRELTWFVLLPALLALAHVGGPLSGRVHGTRGFGLLGALWGGAALVGMASHWQWLDAAGPWLSLIRYTLIALAGTLFCLSVVAQRPLFADPDASGPLLGRVLVSLIGCVMLLAWLVGAGIVVFLTPFPVALAPREQGLRYERVLVSDWRDCLVWLAWSPDSRRLVGQGRDLVVVDVAAKSRTVVSPHGMVDPDSPWQAEGKGFYFTRPGVSSDLGVWYAPLDGTRPRKLASDLVGVAACSPDGRAIAYNGSRGTTVINADGTNPRVLTQQSGAPRWSPDGKHLLVLSGKEAAEPTSVVSMDGRTRPLPVPAVGLDEVAWVGSESFATLTVSPAPPSLSSCWEAEVVVWDLEGAARRRYRLGRYLGSGQCTLAATRDGRRLAIGLDIGQSFGSSLLMLELRSGRLSRLPAPDYSPGGLAWSPDGRSLALSDVVEEEHERGYSYVAVISGF